MLQYLPAGLTRLLVNRSAWSVALQRRIHHRWMTTAGVPASVTLEKTSIQGVPAQWVIPAESSADRFVFYLHGGGFMLGSSDSHAPYVARLCSATHSRGLILDYRRTPEHTFPAALHDSIAVFRWMFERHVNPSNLVMAGDGAGANLLLSTLLTLRKEGHPQPAASLLVSPWVDLVDTSRKLRFPDRSQRSLESLSLELFASSYAAEFTRSDPLISPVNADLSGLPPILLQCGREETLAEDAERLARNAKQHGVEVYLEQYEGARHALPLLVTRDAGADLLVEHAARFLNGHFQVG